MVYLDESEKLNYINLSIRKNQGVLRLIIQKEGDSDQLRCEIHSRWQVISRITLGFYESLLKFNDSRETW